MFRESRYIQLEHKCEREIYTRTFQVEKSIASTGIKFYCPYCGVTIDG